MAEKVGGGQGWRRGWLGPLLVFLAMVLAGAIWLGVFAPVDVKEADGGAYHYIYKPYQGSYSGMSDFRDKLASELKRAGTAPGLPVAVILQEGQSKEQAIGQARVGFLINPGEAVPTGFQAAEWPKQRVVVAEVKANPAIATMKAYAKLNAWLQAHGLSPHPPFMEIEGPGNRFRVLMPLGKGAYPSASPGSMP